MAERRMFTKKVTDSDAFTEMPSASQALYFHLNQGADDDGFNNQIQMAMFKAHASTDDLKILLAKNFIIRFESGVIVIKHWRMHNTIRKDRYTPTNFKDELEQLGIKDSGAYTQWLPNGCQMVATGKDSIGKVSEDKDSIDDNMSDKPTIIRSIIDYLNEKADKKYRANNKVTQKHINARLKEGYTIEDFKCVIDKKCAEWKNTDMEQYLRPETLFGTKFEGYLNAKINKKGSENNESTNGNNKKNEFSKWCTGGTVL